MEEQPQDLVNSLEFLLEFLNEILVNHDYKTKQEKELSNHSTGSFNKNKLHDHTEFFEEFIRLEEKIINKIEILGKIKLDSQLEISFLNKVKRYKSITIKYQSKWKNDYWFMYNSVKTETLETEYCTNPSLKPSIEDQELEKINFLIDNTEENNETLEKNRTCTCTIF